MIVAQADEAMNKRMTGDDPRFMAEVEVLLLVADRPIPEQRLIEVLDIEGAQDPGEVRSAAIERVRSTIERLNDVYEETARAFRIVKLAGGYQVMTLPEHGELLSRLRGERQLQRITPAALETLAIIAYRQPILRADLESIRGVACGEVLRGLLDRRLVRITGRADEIGRPMLYGTTKEFLQVFGLSSLKDLPQAKDL
ncbi:MAG: SMC-Scp complex subunit ScpB [Planctomycetota bacterium]|nr:SMC-Scp complex subunit ScpB [Planctomycetota bacterium]MED5508009.1 SMC-Scp complex subunit ScpB [Planctomycetota bacterium]